MATLLNACEQCIDLVFDECTDIVIAPTSGLEANATYWWFVEDGQGNIYKHSATTDGAGVLSISPDYLPAGFLTAGIGVLSITIRDDEHASTNTTLTYGGTDYDCINATFETATELTGYYE